MSSLAAARETVASQQDPRRMGAMAWLTTLPLLTFVDLLCLRGASRLAKQDVEEVWWRHAQVPRRIRITTENCSLLRACSRLSGSVLLDVFVNVTTQQLWILLGALPPSTRRLRLRVAPKDCSMHDVAGLQWKFPAPQPSSVTLLFVLEELRVTAVRPLAPAFRAQLVALFRRCSRLRKVQLHDLGLGHTLRVRRLFEHLNCIDDLHVTESSHEIGLLELTTTVLTALLDGCTSLRRLRLEGCWRAGEICAALRRRFSDVRLEREDSTTCVCTSREGSSLVVERCLWQGSCACQNASCVLCSPS